MPIILFNVLSMATGYFLPQFFGIDKKQAIAIGMEIGIHNGTLAIYIALNAINNSAMSVPPAIYSLLMFFTAAAFGFLVKPKALTWDRGGNSLSPLAPEGGNSIVIRQWARCP